MDLADLEPRALWAEFLALCAIPHPSHHEEEAARWALGRFKALGIEARTDSGGNVLARKPASPGKEGRPGVILQAHLDMVPQAAGGLAHDFRRDPIRPRMDPKDRDWVVAAGTTLGADNGIGVAAALALMADPGLSHPPLECLFTTNEEDGMGGARAVEPGSLRGGLLLNLDGEDDREITISCAGTLRTRAELPLASEPAPGGFRWLELKVSGLLGGHSGVDIDKGRGNASLLLCRAIREAARAAGGVSVARLSGGTASNAIPREAKSLVGCPEAKAADFEKALRRSAEAIGAELEATDPGFELKAEEAAAPSFALTSGASTVLLDLLLGIDNGLLEMDPELKGLIRSSSNLGELEALAEAGGGRARTLVLVRSSVEAEKERIGSGIEARFRAAGAATTRPAVSPAWAPNLGSPLLALAKGLYREMYGTDPIIGATHGGLETGLFRPLFPSWDMISIGPLIQYPHSPDERVCVSSVARFYGYVRELVARL